MSRDMAAGQNAPASGSTQWDIGMLKQLVDGLTAQVEDLQKLVISHDNELSKRKQITNTYVDAVLSKIEILKNIIKKNIGDEDEFISQHLLMVESIEEQIKSVGKISDKQFKTLNDIYKKQKRV